MFLCISMFSVIISATLPWFSYNSIAGPDSSFFVLPLQIAGGFLMYRSCKSNSLLYKRFCGILFFSAYPIMAYIFLDRFPFYVNIRNCTRPGLFISIISSVVFTLSVFSGRYSQQTCSANYFLY